MFSEPLDIYRSIYSQHAAYLSPTASTVTGLQQPEGYAALLFHPLIHRFWVYLEAMELRRVLKPGGVVEVRDADEGANAARPSFATAGAGTRTRVADPAQHGGNPFMGRHHRRLLREAGFAAPVAEATTYAGGSTQTT